MQLDLIVTEMLWLHSLVYDCCDKMEPFIAKNIVFRGLLSDAMEEAKIEFYLIYNRYTFITNLLFRPTKHIIRHPRQPKKHRRSNQGHSP